MSIFGGLRRRLDPLAEDGLALVIALVMLAFFSAATVTAITMTSSTQTTATRGNASQNAYAIAEAGINGVEAKLNYSNTSGTNPSGANLLGCAGATGANDTNGPSNCTSPSPMTFCITVAAGCANASAGSASVYGYFGGANSTTYAGTTVPASTWLIMSTGYVKNPNGTGNIARAASALIKVSPLGSGAIASVWNHIFLTAPLVPNVCQTTFSGNNTILDAPIYSIGNLCLTGSNIVVEEAAGGQHVDLMVGGKLILGTGTTVGQSAALPIWSGVAVGGCNTTGVANATTACDSGSYSYWVTNKDTFLSQNDPELTDAQVENDYTTFDPGPKHTCLAGTTPAPLADNQFDFNIAANEGTTVMPDTSGSGSSGGSFELAPNSSYACISKNGTSTGYLIWNNGASSITVSGITVPSKTLAINGNVFLDSDLTISQPVTYTGTGMLMVAGAISLNVNGTTICATGTSCIFSNWQGNSGNNSMLSLATLKQNATSFTLVNNNHIFQGSLWGRTNSSMSFIKNNDIMEGPISFGSFATGTNNANFKPLPVIKNMPTGAPVPPNTNATVSPPVLIR